MRSAPLQPGCARRAAVITKRPVAAFMRHGPRWVRGWTATREGTDPLRELVLLLLVEVVAGELALELLDSAGGVDERALAGVEGVRAGPHFDVHLRNRGADRHDDVASEVDLALGVVLGVDLVLHGTLQGLGEGTAEAVGMVGERNAPENREVYRATDSEQAVGAGKPVLNRGSDGVESALGAQNPQSTQAWALTQPIVPIRLRVFDPL